MNRRRSLSMPTVLLTPEQIAHGTSPPANPAAAANDIAPMFCSIQNWCRLSGLSRSATYQALADGWLPSLKMGKSRLIDFYPAIEAVRAKFGTQRAA